MGAAGRQQMDFGQYLKKIGLAEKQAPLTAKEKKAIAKAASLKAKKIMMADLGQRGKK